MMDGRERTYNAMLALVQSGSFSLVQGDPFETVSRTFGDRGLSKGTRRGGVAWAPYLTFPDFSASYMQKFAKKEFQNFAVFAYSLPCPHVTFKQHRTPRIEAYTPMRAHLDHTSVNIIRSETCFEQRS
jgi:hypothetical protein